MVAWFIAQTWKVIAGLIQGRKANQPTNLASLIGYVTRSGGMPSGHTASLTALIICLGYLVGYDSAVFVLGVGVWIIVVYDAVNVRYAVGEQGKALNGLLKEAKKPALPLVEGHTVPQVIVGAIIGLIVGFLVAKVAVFAGADQPKAIFSTEQTTQIR